MAACLGGVDSLKDAHVPFPKKRLPLHFLVPAEFFGDQVSSLACTKQIAAEDRFHPDALFTREVCCRSRSLREPPLRAKTTGETRVDRYESACSVLPR